MMIKFFIVLRRTEQWSKLTVDEYFSKARPRHTGQPEHAQLIRENIDRWMTLPINWFEYRERLKQLVLKSWYIDYITLEEALTIRDKSVVFIPMDDDDILHPDILQHLTQWYEIDDIDSITWNTWTYSLLNCGPMYIKEHENNFHVNWYASLITANCYSIRSTMATSQILEYHNHFSWIRHISRMHIPKELAINFVHPGSTWLMQHLNTTIPDSIYNFLYPIPKELLWAKDFIYEVANLTLPIFGKNV